MLSTVPAFSFTESGLVNQFMDFQTGFTPADVVWIQSFFEPVVPSLSSDESDTGSVRINTGLQNIKYGSDKSNSGSDYSSCLLSLPNSLSNESKTISVKINSGLQNMKTGSDESCAGSFKSNSGSDDSSSFLSLPNSSSDESKTISVKINTGSQNMKSGSDESCAGSNNSGYLTSVPSPQSDELDSNNTKFQKTAANSCLLKKDNNRKGLNRPVMKITDERKRKRMESNRESAKRSRMRKQKQIEDLREEVNRIGLENREIENRLRILLYQIEEVSRVNNWLLSEQEILRRKLSEMRQILILRELQIQQQW